MICNLVRYKIWKKIKFKITLTTSLTNINLSQQHQHQQFILRTQQTNHYCDLGPTTCYQMYEFCEKTTHTEFKKR